jgi:isopentenyl diphosphate isomerase/L-lactate dehydrogenase-like FMN-dependent dehydrogenase
MSSFQFKLSTKPPPLTVEDYRVRARRAVPGMVWAYVDDGAEDMVTMSANRAAFSRYVLRTRVLTGAEATDLSVDIGGARLSLPVLLAPTGLAGLSHWTGELGAAEGAERSGTLSIVSTMSSYSFEEIARSAGERHFFQLYPSADEVTGMRDLTESLIERAQRVGYRGMVVTVDVPARGNRETEVKHGMGTPPILTPARLLNAAVRPRWWINFLRHQRLSARNFVNAGGPSAAMASVKKSYRTIRPEVSWQDLRWMRQCWEGPLFVKGILDADDAARAVDLGADGIVVSNHGGRQLDGTIASLDALPAIAARVGDEAQILLDSGIRRGTDVVKALCLGADAVCIGRPYLYGLAVAGATGVHSVLEILREEIARVMTLMGVHTISELGHERLAAAGCTVPDRVRADLAQSSKETER